MLEIADTSIRALAYAQIPFRLYFVLPSLSLCCSLHSYYQG